MQDHLIYTVKRFQAGAEGFGVAIMSEITGGIREWVLPTPLKSVEGLSYEAAFRESRRLNEQHEK